MITFLTVNASRSNVSQVDLVNYTGNPLVAPVGLVRTENVFNPSDLTVAGANPNRIRAVGGLNMNPFGTLNHAPVMWLTTDGSFVFSKHHPRVAPLPLHEHLENLKTSYPEGAEIKVVSMMEVGNTYINMNNSDVVTFEEVRGRPVTIKCDDAGKWVGFNRITAEWDEVQLCLNVDGQFRVDTIDLVHLTVTSTDGTEVTLALNSEGWIMVAEYYDDEAEERLQTRELTLLDTNPIFNFLIPEGWEPAPAQTKEAGNKNVVSPLMGGPLGTQW